MKKILLLLLVLFILVEWNIIVVKKTNFSPRQKNIDDFSTDIISQCAKATYRPGCYDEEIPKLLPQLSLEESFTVIKEIQKQDTSYGYCHIVGHRISSNEVKKDPAKWMETVARCPVGVCAYGCLHGALQEKARSEMYTIEQITSLKKDLKHVCEEKDWWQPTDLAKTNCYHGMGHLLTYLTNADIKNALAICDEVAYKEGQKNPAVLCFEGVFMQLFQPVEPEDKLIVQGKAPAKEQLRTYCEQFTNLYQKEACWYEGVILFRQEVETPPGLIAFCNQASNSFFKGRCQNYLLRFFNQRNHFAEDKIFNFCNGFPVNKKAYCFTQSALSMLEAEEEFGSRAINLCLKLANLNENFANECFAGIIQRADFLYKRDSVAFRRFCNSLPEEFRRRC